mgnify:CR=1 FL=1
MISNILKHTYYIIPIWNWSKIFSYLFSFFLDITLFLYGIGAVPPPRVIWRLAQELHYSYMELELSSLRSLYLLPFLLHYSYMELELKFGIVFLSFVYITLFLYGIGACFSLDITSNSSGSLHYSYMELELS